MTEEERLAAVGREIRILSLLEASERAGLSPLSSTQLHALAYLANVLAPVWDLVPETGVLLKLRGGPYYPALQEDVDRLVSMTLVEVLQTRFVQSDDGVWRFDGQFQLNGARTAPILEHARTFEDEREVHEMILELCLALSSLDPEALVPTALADATYANPAVAFGQQIDFTRWGGRNSSADIAEYFEYVMPARTRPGVAENIHLYVSLLHDRIAANG